MIHEFEKNIRIMSDLMSYCYRLGAMDYHVDMERIDDEYRCRIRCTLPGMREENVRELDVELNRPRQKEIEQNFWGLSGEAVTDAELTLVGMMVDRAVVTYEGEQLTIRYVRLVD